MRAAPARLRRTAAPAAVRGPAVDYPPVSVVMPVRNEERHLAESVRHVFGQDYPAPLAGLKSLRMLNVRDTKGAADTSVLAHLEELQIDRS